MNTRKSEPITDDAEAVDGFTWAEIKSFIHSGTTQARCTECGDYRVVEPDGCSYDCESCGADGSITSPLIKLGIV